MKKQTAPQSQASDEKIVDMYWQRNPDAIRETEQKYGSMLQKVAYNILFDIQDCEECKSDTYLKIWNTIQSTRPTVFPAFIIHVMRQIAINRYKEKTRKNGYLLNH